MNATRSKVIIQDAQHEPVVGVAAQLLGVLGHDVSLIDTPDAAVAASERADLLVLTVADTAEQTHRLEQIALMPAARRPKQVAILSDADGQDTLIVRRTLPDVKVHVFAKPVHAHGLLGVVKRMAGAN